jgi:hypothetical protein
MFEVAGGAGSDGLGKFDKKKFLVMVRVRVDSDWVGLGLRSNIIDFFWISVISGRVWLSFGFL